MVGWRRKKPSPSAAPSGCPLRHSPLCASCATSPARGRGKKQPAGSLACPLTPFIGEIAGAPEGRAYQSERRADGARKKRCAIPLTRSKELFQPDARSDLPHLGPGLRPGRLGEGRVSRGGREGESKPPPSPSGPAERKTVKAQQRSPFAPSCMICMVCMVSIPCMV